MENREVHFDIFTNLYVLSPPPKYEKVLFGMLSVYKDVPLASV
jgi:hypothetical protein